MRQASCNQNNGRIDVYSQIVSSFELRNASNTVMTATNGNEFHNLAAVFLPIPPAAQQAAPTHSACMYPLIVQLARAGRQIFAVWIWGRPVGIADWITERPFKNLMKSAREDYVPYHEGCNCLEQ